MFPKDFLLALTISLYDTSPCHSFPFFKCLDSQICLDIIVIVYHPLQLFATIC